MVCVGGALPGAMGTDHWEPLQCLCLDSLQDVHAKEIPRRRRASSWPRALAFGQVALGSRRPSVRRGTLERPFVIWVLGATDQVEVELAGEGVFSDANWVERAPTQVVVLGRKLRAINKPSLLEDGQPASVCSACYDAVPFLLFFGMTPDLIAVMMPPIIKEDNKEQLQAAIGSQSNPKRAPI